jgi:tetratricopeptide (TPR) repeat protein
MWGRQVEHSEELGSASRSIADVAARLLLWARRSGKGLALVEYSSEFSRQRVVERVEAELGGTVVQTMVSDRPEVIALLRQGSAADAVQDLVDRLAQVPAGAVVWVTGFAGAFEQVDGLRVLNFNREALAAFPVRQVWWVTPVVGQMLLQATPDLQGWFNPKLRLTESIAVENSGLIQERSSSRAAVADAMERSQKLVRQFEQVRQTDISGQEALKTYLLPALEALAEVGAEQQLRDLTLQFEGFLSQIKDGDRLDIASSLFRLGTLYYQQGRYRNAEPLMKQALAIHKAELGDRHPDTATSLNNLAGLYESMGRYEAAEPLYDEALAIRKAELGDRHPDTATSLNDLAELYRAMGRYEAAEPLYLEALAIRKAELGDRHPDTATSLNNLALLYKSMGRYEAAEPLYLEALEISKAQLGDRHPSTAISLNNLALLYESMGRYEAAEPLFLESLEIRKAELGDRHPSTATSLNNLALLYDSMGRYEAAEPLYLEVVEIFKAQLGDRHPSTATSLNNLAVLYANMKQFDRALPLLEEALSILQAVLPAEHPDILDTQESLVNLRRAIEQQNGGIVNRIWRSVQGLWRSGGA